MRASRRGMREVPAMTRISGDVDRSEFPFKIKALAVYAPRYVYP